MKYLFTLFVVTFTVNGYSQSESDDIACSGYKNSSLPFNIILNGHIQTQFIKRNELIQHGLQIILGNQTFRIIGFKASYDCHSGIGPDIHEKIYIGNKINGEDNFIKGIYVGDNFVLDCINLEKNGIRYLVKGVMFGIQ